MSASSGTSPYTYPALSIVPSVDFAIVPYFQPVNVRRIMMAPDPSMTPGEGTEAGGSGY